MCSATKRWIGRLLPGTVVLAAATALTSASPVVLQIDPTASHIDVTLCATVGTTACDTDGSSVGGTVTLAPDCLTAPTVVSIHDFNFQLLESIDLTLDFGFLVGRLDTVATGVELSYALPGTPRPAVPLAGGAFVDPQVPADLADTLTYAATGGIPPFDLCTLLLASGAPCSDVIDLSTVVLDPIDLTGTLAVSGREITVTIDVDVSGLLDPTNPSLGTLSMVGTVVARGTVPLPDIATFVAVLTGAITDPGVVCESDINEDGRTDGLDVAAYLDAIL